MVLLGTTLSYYEDKEKALKGTIELRGYSVILKDLKTKTFSLVHASERVYVMKTESEEDMWGWMGYLQRACVPRLFGDGKQLMHYPSNVGSRELRESEKQAQGVVQGAMNNLPKQKDAERWLEPSLIRRKCNLCCVAFDFSDETKQVKEKDLKREVLLDLVEFSESSRGLLNDVVLLKDLLDMIMANVCRSLPPISSIVVVKSEDEEEFVDPLWPHLSIVYELLLRIVQSNEIALPVKKKLVSAPLVTSIVDQFDSYDVRERDYVKTITHRIYGKLTNRRAQIRRMACETFYRHSHEESEHNGIAEVLQILGSIINGFAVPVKQNHKDMLAQALMPLHRLGDVLDYQAELKYCMVQYVLKEGEFAEPVVDGLLRYWPLHSSPKELAFLDEIQDIMDERTNQLMQDVVMQDTVLPFEERLLRRMIKSLQSLHFQVATKVADMLLPRTEEEGTLWGTRLLRSPSLRKVRTPNSRSFASFVSFACTRASVASFFFTVLHCFPFVPLSDLIIHHTYCPPAPVLPWLAPLARVRFTRCGFRWFSRRCMICLGTTGTCRCRTSYGESLICMRLR